MRRFSMSPGERVEFHPYFDGLTECVLHGFVPDDAFMENPITVTLLLDPDELIRLAEACRMAVLDAKVGWA